MFRGVTEAVTKVRRAYAVVMPEPASYVLRYRRSMREDMGVFSAAEVEEHAYERAVILLKADYPKCFWRVRVCIIIS